MIYVGGGQRTSSGYLWGIIAKIFESMNLFKSVSSLTAQEHEQLFPVMVNKMAMDIVHPINTSQFSTVMRCFSSGTNNKKFISYQQALSDIDVKARNCSVFQTHTPMEKYIEGNLDKFISHYFFIHRNPIDECVSIIKAQSISPDEDEQIIKDNELPFIIFDYKTNNKNYRIYAEDLKYAFSYLNTSFYQEFRLIALDYLKYKTNKNFHEFSFEQLTISDELNQIRRIAAILGMETDIDDIYCQLKQALNKGDYWKKKGAKLKTNIGFFDDVLNTQLSQLVGDLQVVFNYISLKDYSPFINQNSEFELVFIDMDAKQIKYTEKIFTEFNKAYTSNSYRSIDSIKFNKDKKYIFFTENLLEFKKIKSLQSLDFIIYPYYEALFSYDDSLFMLQHKSKRVHLTQATLNNSLILVDNNFRNSTILQKCNFIGNQSTLLIDIQDGIQLPSHLDSLTNCEIYLFGTGNVAYNLYVGITKNYKHIHVKGFIDSNKNSDYFFDKPVFHIDEVQSLDYDFIIISFLNVKKGIDELQKRGVEDYLAINDNFSINSNDYSELIYCDRMHLFNKLDEESVNYEKLIILSYDLPFIHEVSNHCQDDYNLISLIPMYNYNQKTLFEQFA